MLKTVLGLVAGVIVFTAILVAAEFAARQVPAAREAGAMLAIVVAAYFVSAFAGALVAGRISHEPWTVWAITLLAVAGVVWSIVRLSQPLWMEIGSVVAPILGGYLARRMIGRGSPDVGTRP